MQPNHMVLPPPKPLPIVRRTGRSQLGKFLFSLNQIFQFLLRAFRVRVIPSAASIFPVA